MMECLLIDWKNIDGTFERDEFYENIQAPKWIDFTVPLQPVDDHAWFCGRTGCTHKTKTVLQALNQKSVLPCEASLMSARMVDPLAAKTLSAGFAAKKARAVVSSSLSSLSDLKAAYGKNKVLHHMQMPSIGESKGESAKHSRRQQASENENPNRACKVQDGACKKPMQRALEGIARQTKTSENKGIIGRETTALVPNRDMSICSTKTLLEQVSLSQSGPVLEASKSVFIFGKRDPTHAKSTLSKGGGKIPTSGSSSITETKIKKAGGPQFFSRLPPTARNPYLSASLAMPIVRKSAANARPLRGIYLGNDKVAECKPPRITKDVRVTVQAHAFRKRNDLNKEVLMQEEGKLQERHPRKDTELQKVHTALLSKTEEPQPLVKNDEIQVRNKDSIAIACPASREEHHTQRESTEEESICDMESSAPPIVQDQGNLSVDKNNLLLLPSCVEGKQLPYPFHRDGGKESKGDNLEEESKSNDIQTREKEDSITNTLEKFLKNLQITSHENELVTNEESCESKPGRDYITKQIISDVLGEKELETVITHHGECATEQDPTLKHEAVISTHADCVVVRDLVQSHSEENALEHDVKDDALERVAGFSHHRIELSQMSETLSTKDESNPSSAASNTRHKKDKVISVENDKRIKKTQQKQDFQFSKDWQRHRGTKRKSSELNLICSRKALKHETQTLEQSASTAELHMIPASKPHGLQDLCEEHHKKLKTTMPAFKPFRFRTEERGALKELGLIKKESGIPDLKEMVHHALQMPSFGRPFRPQRSTKKLTIPRQPKFHASRTKNTCTSLATGVAASS